MRKTPTHSPTHNATLWGADKESLSAEANQYAEEFLVTWLGFIMENALKINGWFHLKITQIHSLPINFTIQFTQM